MVDTPSQPSPAELPAPSRTRAARSRRILAWSALSVVLLLSTDNLVGAALPGITSAPLHYTAARSGIATQAVVVFPGYIMSGEILNDALAPHLGPDDAMIVVQYADQGVNIEDIYQRVMDKLESLRPVNLRVYGASMGGLCARDFLDRYARDGSTFGAAVMILDTAPASASDVRRPGWMFAVAHWYRGGPIASATWALISQPDNLPVPEADADATLIAAGHRSGARVGMPALTSQADYLASRTPPQSAELVELASRVVYLRGQSTSPDPLIHVDRSIAAWALGFPRLIVVVLPGREGRWHVPLIARPHETMAAILAV